METAWGGAGGGAFWASPAPWSSRAAARIGSKRPSLHPAFGWTENVEFIIGQYPNAFLLIVMDSKDRDERHFSTEMLRNAPFFGLQPIGETL